MSTLSAAIELAPEDASVPAARHIAVELLKAWHAARPRRRGLRMIQGIADRWGIEDHHGGKRVWLALQHGPASSAR